MHYQLIIFDLDGTLIDSFADLSDSLCHCLSREGFPVPSPQEIRSRLGNGLVRLVGDCMPQSASEEQKRKVLARFLPYYEAHCADKSRPYDGILPLLSRLRGLQLKLAVQSNKRDQPLQLLCRRFFCPYIDMALGEKESMPLKPAPDGVRFILRQLNVRPENAVYVGDSEVDLQTAANAGVDCIAVDWGFRSARALRQSGASRIASSPQELYRLLTEDR